MCRKEISNCQKLFLHFHFVFLFLCSIMIFPSGKGSTYSLSHFLTSNIFYILNYTSNVFANFKRCVLAKPAELAELTWQIMTYRCFTILLPSCSFQKIIFKQFKCLLLFNPLSTFPTKWWNTLKQFVVNSKRIVWVCLTILWGWRLKG